MWLHVSTCWCLHGGSAGWHDYKPNMWSWNWVHCNDWMCFHSFLLFFFLNSEPTIKQTEWIRNRMAGLREPLRGIKPMIHVNTLSFHVELCHGNLVTGQATGLSHSIFKNTRIYGQINWVQLHLVLLGWIPPPLFLSFSTSPLSYLLFCKVLSFKQTRSISISSCVSRTECLIYLGTKPGNPPGLSKAKILSYYRVSSPRSLKYIQVLCMSLRY